ncbi:AGROH133_08824 family phage infection protein [Rhizobium paknamense]|uniref:DUF4345 domain-containing protein n=1 Tax=Rhizobium paknamense TaxID=1206817 RepID=A0ABU0IEM8_9HYPH|nr:DUF4345 domain-containing protein [Rhizobium paknamense]MDQ0456611.1 hypothetical protein [Rhizobium paknamense]
MEFYFPTEFGEQMAFTGAALTAFIGLVVMFAPGLILRFLGLVPLEGRNEGFGALRGGGGVLLGLGLSALLLAQPMVYLALGAALGLGCFGRILSILSDHGASWRNVLLLVVFLLLAALPLAYVFGLA